MKYRNSWVSQTVAFFSLIFQKSLRLVETGEFILIPSKTRGRIGRIELNQVSCSMIVVKYVIVFLKADICVTKPMECYVLFPSIPV